MAIEAEGPLQEDSTADADLDEALAHLGYDEFRPGQREAVRTLFEQRRLLLVAPTGGGKSLTYQLPATLLPGTTLVVSPLISLMNDQVEALVERGISATFLASTLESDEIRKRMAKMADGEYKLVYVAPERLPFDGFRALVAKLDCPLVAIDEAHCISEWGHDFRPEYMQIGEILPALPNARVLACTATATPMVRDEILARLGLAADTPQLIHGFARPNLALRATEVRTKRERESIVDKTLAEALGEPLSAEGAAIVYAPTRKTTDSEAKRLEDAGWHTASYHAGMTAKSRERAHRGFSNGTVNVVVATNAFGMGIDRADVRAVVHLAPPGSMEAYYQEVGRAGRDGEDAIGQLLVSPGDMAMRRRMVESDIDGNVPDPERVAHRWNLFLELMRWAEGGSCRHDAILRYFGDEAETLAGCGRCDVCLNLAGNDDSDPEEVSLLVRKALSATARVHGRFGLNAAAKLLRGAKDDRLLGAGLTDTKTFGILSDRPEEWLTRLLRRCVTAGWIDFYGDERPVVVLTEEGRSVMMGDRPARMLLPPAVGPKAPAGARSGAGRRGRSAAEDELDEAGLALFEALRGHRLELAREEGVPPYVVASDRALRDIAQLRPRTLDELMLAHGIGPSKADKYGEGFLRVIASALPANAPADSGESDTVSAT